MSTHNIQCHDKMRKNPSIFVFLSYWKDFVGTEKRVRIIQGKRAIRVRTIEVILYFDSKGVRLNPTNPKIITRFKASEMKDLCKSCIKYLNLIKIGIRNEAVKTF